MFLPFVQLNAICPSFALCQSLTRRIAFADFVLRQIAATAARPSQRQKGSFAHKFRLRPF